MTDFRNGYHFVPRANPTTGTRIPDRQSEYGLKCHAVADGHAAYAPGTSSGRVVCRVRLECPTVIGGRRENGEANKTYSIVAPFLFGRRPALPATSLKGVISSVAESAARAPFRVLKDEKLTVSYSEVVFGGNRVSRRFYEGHADPAKQLTRVHDHVPEPSRPLILNPQTTNRVTRSLVNPVEAMFGFVRESADDTKKLAKGTVVSAAGKLRFSHALPSGDWAEKPTTEFFLKGDLLAPEEWSLQGLHLVRLKEQGQPMKVPMRAPNHGTTPPEYDDLRSATPNFYFVHATQPDAHISKQDFAANPGNYRIQGGKFYLHHPDAATDQPAREPWRTADLRRKGEDLFRKAAVPVLRKHVTFDFHIDFDNLSDHELGILCFALRPSERFRHKIGLGKGLGLGSVKIDFLDLVIVDRKARYSNASVFQEDPRHSTRTPDPALAQEHARRHDAWLQTNDRSARSALLAIGQTHRFDDEGKSKEPVPVSWVPLVEAKHAGAVAGPTWRRLAAEHETFEWFSTNDQRREQKLKPISGDLCSAFANEWGSGARAVQRGSPAERQRQERQTRGQDPRSGNGYRASLRPETARKVRNSGIRPEDPAGFHSSRTGDQAQGRCIGISAPGLNRIATNRRAISRRCRPDAEVRARLVHAPAVFCCHRYRFRGSASNSDVKGCCAPCQAV